MFTLFAFRISFYLAIFAHLKQPSAETMKSMAINVMSSLIFAN